MAEGRILKRQISDSKKLGALQSDSPRLLYTWLIPWLDIEDRHTADPDLIKGHIFPKCKSWGIRKIERCLNELKDERLIILYESNGERYLQFTKTLQKKYRDKETPSKIPPPPENSRELQRTPPKKKGKESKKKESIKVLEQIIDYFNKSTRQKRSYTCDETNKLINGRLNEGRTFEDFKHVIDTKTTQWQKDSKMRKFLRPSTLFRPGHFEDYLHEDYEDPKKEKYQPGVNPKGKATSFIDTNILHEAYKICDKEGINKEEFYDKAKKVFPIIKTTWEQSDKNPATFVRLVEEAR